MGESEKIVKMSLPNFNEVNIPSDSEEEDDYQGIEWSNVSHDKMSSNDLILTIGNLSSTAIECGVEEMNEVETVEKVDFSRSKVKILFGHPFQKHLMHPV